MATTIVLTQATPGSGYTLQTARTELKRILPWLTRTVDMEPLDGLANGTNKVFHLPITPADDATTVSFYDTNGTAVAGATVSNYDYGSVLFATGSVPSATVYAS